MTRHKNIAAHAEEHIAHSSPQKSSTKNKGLVVSVLHDISKTAVRMKDVSMLLKRFSTSFNRVNLTRGTVTLRKGDLLTICASHGLSEDERKRGVYRIGEGVTGDVAARGVSRVVPDISKSPDFLNRTLSRVMSSKTAFLCVPIFNRGNVIGTLSIDRTDPTKYILRRDLKLLETIAITRRSNRDVSGTEETEKPIRKSELE